MMLTIALFRYSISDKFLSRRSGLIIDYWAVLFLITVLAFLKLIILQDVLCLLLFARYLYPQKEVADDTKGSKSIPDDCYKKRAFRIAASLFV